MSQTVVRSPGEWDNRPPLKVQVVPHKKRRARANNTVTVVIALAVLTAVVALGGGALWAFKKPAVIEVPVVGPTEFVTITKTVPDKVVEDKLTKENDRLRREKVERDAKEERERIEEEEQRRRAEEIARLRTASVPGEWDFVWTPVNLLRALPAIHLVGTGGAVITGTFLPANERGPFPFTASLISDDTLRFEVADQEGRHVWVEMAFRPSRDHKSIVAAVKMWRLAEDVVAEIARVNRQSMPPQQRQRTLVLLQVELKNAGKKIDLGLFRGAKDPGQSGK